MRERYLTFDGITTESLGLVYSSFVETLPEPKTIYVDVPGAYPIDVSEVFGDIVYGNGIHVLTFLLYASTQEERLATKAHIMALFHGKRAYYRLSWVDGRYYGRAAVAFEHRWDDVDVVTITITHDPFWTNQVDYYIYPTATSKSAATASIVEYLSGAEKYSVTVRTYQSGSANFLGKTPIAIDNSSVSIGTSSAGSDGTVAVLVTVNDWWVGSSSDGARILNSAHFPDPDEDGNVTTDSDWTRSGTNLACSNYTSKQRAYIVAVGKGF